MLDGDPPVNGEAADSELAVAQERIRGLEERVELLQGQLEQERLQNAEMVHKLKAGQNRRRTWWRVWERNRG